MSFSLHFTPTPHFTPVTAEPVACRGMGRLKTLLLVSFAVAALCAPFRAAAQPPATQQPAAQTPAATGNPALNAKQVAQMFDDLDDIDRLTSLNPLKLTADQLDRLIAAVSVAKEAYDKQYLTLANAALKTIADEIHDVKRKALAGGELPEDFNNRAKKASVSVAAAYSKLDTENLANLAPVIHEILTASQVAVAVKLCRNSAAQAGRPTAGTDTQWFNQYVMSVIISYPRIVPLLKEMRAAIGGGSTPKSADERAGGNGATGAKAPGDGK
jgi:hypothetical protein